VYHHPQFLLIVLHSIGYKCKLINFNQYNLRAYLYDLNFLWSRIVLYPLSVRQNFVVCPCEPLLKLGVPWVKKDRGTMGCSFKANFSNVLISTSTSFKQSRHLRFPGRQCKCIVTYSGVLFHNGTFLHSKFNTQLLITVSKSITHVRTLQVL
jgi:hypothetical protein